MLAMEFSLGDESGHVRVPFRKMGTLAISLKFECRVIPVWV